MILEDAANLPIDLYLSFLRARHHLPQTLVIVFLVGVGQSQFKFFLFLFERPRTDQAFLWLIMAILSLDWGSVVVCAFGWLFEALHDCVLAHEGGDLVLEV